MPETALRCHPETPTAVVRAVTADVKRVGERLAVRFRIAGDLACLRVPPPAPPRRVDGLWQHTCCEVFIAASGPAYHELNLAPSGAWAVYEFTSYRDVASFGPDDLSPGIAVERTVEQLELSATIALPLLNGAYASVPLSLGLSAVIEDHDSRLSYWALWHPPGKADFHHGDAFQLRLEPPAGK